MGTSVSVILLRTIHANGPLGVVGDFGEGPLGGWGFRNSLWVEQHVQLGDGCGGG
jgi:hypothetical protein